jgi:asparagine synthase (glutamine-hydrolysing)
MPGLIGFAGGVANGRTLLSLMAHALEPDKRFKTESYTAEGIGLGRVSLGILNPRPQPHWNADQTVCLVMEGELFATEPLRQELTRRGCHFAQHDDPELILHLYQEFGCQFPQMLNGAFAVAIWDGRTQTLLVANDRLGLYPLYYAQAGGEPGADSGRLLFASGVRAILADTAVPRTIDRIALAQYLTFDHCLHDSTFVQAVRLLPPASLLTWQAGRLTIAPTWRPHMPRQYELIPERDWLEMTKEAMRTAVERQSGGAARLGMLLSGGLDSRYLLGLICGGAANCNLQTFTWGIPHCDDARYAREAAASRGTNHHFFELRPDWLMGLADECARQVDGMGNILNLHARAVVEQCAPHADVIVKGFLGDAMAGYAQMHQHWADYDDDTRIQAHLSVHRAQGVITFEQPEQDELFTPEFRTTVGNAVWESYRRGMDESGSTLLADQRIYFDYRQRVPRHTLNGVEVVRARAAVRLPFADNDLIDLFLRMPPGLRYGRRIMRDAFIEEYPDLAKIPSPDDGLPMIECARTTRIRVGRLVRWQLQKAGLKQVSYLGLRPYKDYPAWFRGPLRPWVEATLLDKRHLERGDFNPDTIRRLVNEHMSGQHNHVLKLGALLSIELWRRQCID